MTPTAVPSRITIDFRDAALPSRTWILGVDEAASGRMELIAFDGAMPGIDVALPHRAPTRSEVPAGVTPAAMTADCACPEFCERDHANE
jgi:hypothetical protein